MSQKKEIQVLSKILNLINRYSYDDRDEFAIALARSFIENSDEQDFIKGSSKIKTSFFRRNRIKKEVFLNEVFKEICNIQIVDENLRFPQQIFLDDIDSFAKVKKIKPSTVGHLNLPEKEVEDVFKLIINEPYEHKHFGGELSDGLTTRVKFRGRRVPTAIAFNGRGKIKNKEKGLTIANCGTNGNQIQNLFKEPASLFILQSVGRIHNAVYAEMAAYAYEKSNGGKKEVYYCLIDGNDTDRIMKAIKGGIKNGRKSRTNKNS